MNKYIYTFNKMYILLHRRNIKSSDCRDCRDCRDCCIFILSNEYTIKISNSKFKTSILLSTNNNNFTYEVSKTFWFNYTYSCDNYYANNNKCCIVDTMLELFKTKISLRNFKDVKCKYIQSILDINLHNEFYFSDLFI